MTPFSVMSTYAPRRIAKEAVRLLLLGYYKMRTRILFSRTHVRRRSNTLAIGKVFIVNRGSIEIGRNCLLIASVLRYKNYVEPVSMYTMTRNSKITIGDNVTFNGGFMRIHYSLTIGDGTIVAPGVKIIDHDHELEPSERGHETIFPGRPISIGRHVWIGFNAVILKGVCIGEGSVVAAGSVVTKDVPPFTVVAGTPAQFIKKIKGYE